MGLGTQMIGWHDDFCAQLAGRGFFVVRYDNRDVGRSTHFDDRRRRRRARSSPAASQPRLHARDMADDGVGLLDELGVDAAHIVGASMGGMIAQLMAAWWPDRVRSLVSIMSSTGSRRSGQPALRVYPSFLTRPPRTKEEYIERLVKIFGIIGSPGFERNEDDLRLLAETSFDRGANAAGSGRQLAAIQSARAAREICAGSRRRRSSFTVRPTSSCARPAGAPPRAPSPTLGSN